MACGLGTCITHPSTHLGESLFLSFLPLESIRHRTSGCLSGISLDSSGEEENLATLSFLFPSGLAFWNLKAREHFLCSSFCYRTYSPDRMKRGWCSRGRAVEIGAEVEKYIISNTFFPCTIMVFYGILQFAKWFLHVFKVYLHLLPFPSFLGTQLSCLLHIRPGKLNSPFLKFFLP